MITFAGSPSPFEAANSAGEDQAYSGASGNRRAF
jgi:hypothetical protein